MYIFFLESKDHKISESKLPKYNNYYGIILLFMITIKAIMTKMTTQKLPKGN